MQGHSWDVSTKTVVRKGSGGTYDVLLSVVPPAASERLPADICVVVDVSGSMQMEATVKGRQEVGAPRLSVLDIVRHAVKTVVHTMGPQDRLGIVAYSDKATTHLQLTAMDETGKSAADAALDALSADGQTNLWDGLRTGLDILYNNIRAGASAAVMLLTDGVPNVEPSGGHLPALQQYREDRGSKLPGVLHTFGFGKDLDSKLLNDLACEGEGLYIFIPDASFVGTALVNCMSNTLVTMGRNGRLSLDACEGCSIQSVKGHGGLPDAKHHMVPFGSLQIGQRKDVIVRMDVPEGITGPFVQAELSFDGPGGPTMLRLDGDQSLSHSSFLMAEDEVQSHRLGLVEAIAEAIRVAGADGEGLQAANSCIQALVFEGCDELTQSLKQDVEGQVCEALSRQDWYTGWGAHYLRSLARAHLTQQCNNFKDPGVQVYGGTLFDQVRDVADEIFLELPPPSPENRGNVEMLVAMGFPESEVTRALAAAHDNMELAAQYLMEGIPSRPAPYHGGGGHAAPAAAPAAGYSMRAYYDSSGPCFSGASLVLRADGVEQPIEQLQKGDRLWTQDGSSAEVVCMVETQLPCGKARLVDVTPGMQTTPWHPVQLEQGGAWFFPAQIGLVCEHPCDVVYNLVLDRGHVLRVGGAWTVSLGHGLQDETVRHAYWGSQQVVRDLQRLCGWKEGRVLLGPGCVVRRATGDACGLRQSDLSVRDTCDACGLRQSDLSVRDTCN